MKAHTYLKRLRSLKGLLREIIIVIIGILIALGIDQFTENLKHKQLVEQSIDNIKKELELNKKRIENRKGNFDSLIVLINALNDNSDFDKDTSIHYNYGYIHLSATAWQTAQITQAIQYMKYEDITSIASIYSLQNEVLDLQKKNIDNLLPLLSTISNASENSSKSHKRDMQTMLYFLEAQKSFMIALSEEYDKILKTLKK